MRAASNTHKPSHRRSHGAFGALQLEPVELDNKKVEYVQYNVYEQFLETQSQRRICRHHADSFYNGSLVCVCVEVLVILVLHRVPLVSTETNETHSKTIITLK